MFGIYYARHDSSFFLDEAQSQRDFSVFTLNFGNGGTHICPGSIELGPVIADCFCCTSSAADSHVQTDFEPLDARLGTALDSEMANVYNVEATTRNLSKIVTLDKIESMLYAIKNEYWRSVAAVIALYNMRRAGVSVDDLMIVHNYISNEFADLIGVEPVA